GLHIGLQRGDGRSIALADRKTSRARRVARRDSLAKRLQPADTDECNARQASGWIGGEGRERGHGGSPASKPGLKESAASRFQWSILKRSTKHFMERSAYFSL